MTGYGAGLDQFHTPEAARRRIKSLRDRAGRWTSGIDTADLLALRRVGIRPAGQVAGVATFTEQAFQGGYGSRQQVADAMLVGRRLALDRLTQEAVELGAHGIVDLTLNSRPLGNAEFPQYVLHEATGTAVVVPDGEPPERPFTAALGARDVALLIRSGFMPCAVALGCGAWLVGSPLGTMGAPQPSQRYQPWEVVNWGRALAEVRLVAIRRMRAAANEAGGTEVVGVQMTTATRRLEADVTISVVALGTTVVPFGTSSLPPIRWLLTLGLA